MIDNARARVLRLFQSDNDNRTRGHEIIFRERVDVRDIGIFFPADARTSRSRLGTDIDPRFNTCILPEGNESIPSISSQRNSMQRLMGVSS